MNRFVTSTLRCYQKSPTTLSVWHLGLPDIPYFTGAPIFQPQSPASRNEATREMKSPVFKLEPLTSRNTTTSTLHTV